MIERKYFKPKSLTWWGGVAPLIAGVVIASEPLHNLTNVVLVLGTLTGHAPVAVLINAGLFAIGLRGKDG